jgi:hypothetical protein
MQSCLYNKHAGGLREIIDEPWTGAPPLSGARQYLENSRESYPSLDRASFDQSQQPEVDQRFVMRREEIMPSRTSLLAEHSDIGGVRMHEVSVSFPWISPNGIASAPPHFLSIEEQNSMYTLGFPLRCNERLYKTNMIS